MPCKWLNEDATADVMVIPITTITPTTIQHRLHPYVCTDDDDDIDNMEFSRLHEEYRSLL